MAGRIFHVGIELSRYTALKARRHLCQSKDKILIEQIEGDLHNVHAQSQMVIVTFVQLDSKYDPSKLYSSPVCSFIYRILSLLPPIHPWAIHLFFLCFINFKIFYPPHAIVSSPVLIEFPMNPRNNTTQCDSKRKKNKTFYLLHSDKRTKFLHSHSSWRNIIFA